MPVAFSLAPPFLTTIFKIEYITSQDTNLKTMKIQLVLDIGKRHNCEKSEETAFTLHTYMCQYSFFITRECICVLFLQNNTFCTK